MAKTNDEWLSQIAGRPVHVEPPTDLGDIERLRALLPPDHPAPRPETVGLAEVTVVEAGPEGPPVEVYVPKPTATPPPFLLWLHGGGWCTGSAASARETPLWFARQGIVVANVDYSLAPERPFPSALREVLASLGWAYRAAADFGADPARIVAGGASAGANLAAAAFVASSEPGTATARLGVDAPQGHLAGLALLYGVFDFPLMNAEPGSNAGFVEVLFNRAYLGPSFLARARDPLVSPVYASTHSLFPPSYLACGSRDSLLGQTLSLAKVLADSDAEVSVSIAAGLDHSFDLLVDRDRRAEAEMNRLAEWIRAVEPPARDPDSMTDS